MGDEYWGVDGLHRCQAAIERGEELVPCVVRDGDAKEAMMANLVLNTLRGHTKASEQVAVLGELFDVQGVGIDEAQFFDETIVEVCRELVSQGKGVVVAGLDLDFRGRPFGSMPDLLATADFVTKLHAACVVCGGVATRSQRVVDSQEQVVVGGASAYEARCRKHWNPEPVFAQGQGMSDD